MKNLLNVEKSGFRRGEYVGYAGGAWRIYKHHIGSWQGWKATHQTTGETIEAHSLAQISKKLEEKEKTRK